MFYKFMYVLSNKYNIHKIYTIGFQKVLNGSKM